MKTREQYISLANLFRYPDEDYKKNVSECAKMLKENYHEAYSEILPFVQFVEANGLYEIEEVFGKTFHIQAICFLDLGYVLFAEDYKRGEFLVKMKDEQRRANNDCGDELADNLPNVLTLMAIMKDEEFLGEFAVRIVEPSLEKMLAEFDQVLDNKITIDFFKTFSITPEIVPNQSHQSVTYNGDWLKRLKTSL